MKYSEIFEESKDYQEVIVQLFNIPNTGYLYKFYPTGEVYMKARIYEGIFNNEMLVYYPSGQLKFKLYMEDGYPWGPYKEYHPNGQLQAEGFIRYIYDGINKIPLVYLDGHYYEFDYAGFITLHVEYKLGELIKNYLE